MAQFFFAPKDPEFFCMRQKRLARERVERVKEILTRDLANPPDCWKCWGKQGRVASPFI
jgi:hypothetical protein